MRADVKDPSTWFEALLSQKRQLRQWLPVVVVPPRGQGIGKFNLEPDFSIPMLDNAALKTGYLPIELPFLKISSERTRSNSPCDSLQHHVPPMAGIDDR